LSPDSTEPFKQYEVERKQAIERYIQLVFLAWTLVTVSEQADVAFWVERGGLSVRLDHVKEAYLVETVLNLFEEIDPSLPRAERRAVVHDRVSVLSWSFVANFLITVSEIVDLLNERGGSYGGALSLETLR